MGNRWGVALLGLWLGPALAQGGAAGPGSPVVSLEEVRVTADPLAPAEVRATRPVSVLQGQDLQRALDTAIGSTLAGQPGVHSSAFGAAAGRPVIRGQDGARVRVTQDGLDSFDASATSPDHAVAIDPLAARRVEVLRGPATLLYGGAAIGGLVNIGTGRIPPQRLGAPEGGALLTADPGNHGHQSALGVSGGQGGLNWSIGGFERRAGDYRIPGRIDAADPASTAARLPNSRFSGEGGHAGLSWVGDRLTLGLAHGELGSRYGIPTEADVSIRLKQQRTDALAIVERPLPGIARLRATLADGRYRHDEVEGSGQVGTAFRSSGRESRVELTHEPIAQVRGVFGWQGRERTLRVSGDEAYLPGNQERQDALFYVGERALGPTRLEFGWRGEQARLRPDAATGLPGRDFSLQSASAGVSLPLDAAHRIGLNLAMAQRAPAAEELYANGPHAATATLEIGDAALSRERSMNLDLSVRRTTGALRWKAGLYANRFSNYIHGRTTDENGDGIADRVDAANHIENSAAAPGAGEFTRLVYTQAGARFNGLEAELTWQPAGSPWGLRLFGDTARGRIDGEGNAPRMAPTRVGASLDIEHGAWSGFVSAMRVAGQNRIAALETRTDGYTRVDAEIAWRARGGDARGLTLFLQGRNLLNETIRPHTSFVKDRVPQPGRTVMAGLRASF
ncbi:MAG: TonB-dependent receptor [Betaproteobacteria bacterium]|nr:TonB-dependent receptor [Betaproteobacteria bacterium]